jgi:hypothetical protein
MLCDYGCGKQALYQFKNGKWCCSKSRNSCKEVIKNNPMKDLKIREKCSKTKKGQHYILSQKEIERKRQWMIQNTDRLRSLIQYPKSENTKKKHSISAKEKFKDQTIRNKMGHPLTIKKINEKYQIFSEIEELRYNPDSINFSKKEIQCRCKNPYCKNSKENNGWFTPKKSSLLMRIYQLERPDGNKKGFLFCCKECKNMGKTESDWKIYRKKVWNETKVTLIKYSNKIKNLDLRGRKYGYALDHKFSVSDGFKNNVEPSIIAHYKNLQIISISENSKKQHNSNISLEELFTGMENK